MRSRNIKPAFFKNESLAALPPECRLLYIGLWCLADREGRLEDRPKRIKAELFPYENRNVDTLLNKLAASGFIVRYNGLQNLDSRSYISIPKFLCHQNPHVNEKPSIIPAPSDITIIREDSGTNPADSLLLIPDSLLRIPDNSKSNLEDFDTFWKLYPKKEGKGKAKETFIKATAAVGSATIISGLVRQLGILGKKERQFIPMPATWLHQERWGDELDAPVTGDIPAWKAADFDNFYDQ